MAKLSRTVKDTLQIVVFLLVVGILLTTFIIYPLNRTKALMARVDIEDFNPDSLPPNDPQPFIDSGFAADSFTIEADGLTSLACLFLKAPTDSMAPADTSTPRGLAILLHDEHKDRNSMLPMARVFIDSGFTVVLYDQRANGLTTGEYHGEGQYEAADLEEVMSHLGIREQLIHPVVVVGKALGADAAILAAQEESRIDAVVAIEPYLTTDRWLELLFEEHNTYWIPFRCTMIWFWYGLRSAYAAPYRELEHIEGVACQTLILTSPEHAVEPEFVKLTELSETGKLQTVELPDDEYALIETVIRFVRE